MDCYELLFICFHTMTAEEIFDQQQTTIYHIHSGLFTLMIY